MPPVSQVLIAKEFFASIRIYGPGSYAYGVGDDRLGPVPTTALAPRYGYYQPIESRVGASPGTAQNYDMFLMGSGVHLAERDIKRVHIYLDALSKNHNLRRENRMWSGDELIQSAMHAAARHHENITVVQEPKARVTEVSRILFDTVPTGDVDSASLDDLINNP